MIFIQSEEADASTDDVGDWLKYYARSYVKCENEVILDKLVIKVGNENTSTEITTAQGVNIYNPKSTWYRRGSFQFTYFEMSPQTYYTASRVYPYCFNEMQVTKEMLDYILFAKSGINKYADNATNKIINLQKAASLGLKIPETLITNDAAEVQKLIAKHGTVITKSVGSHHIELRCDQELTIVSCQTAKVTMDDLKPLKNVRKALPALYQQYIDKKLDIRTFCLKGNFYSMAIFSQSCEQTKLDFRNFDPRAPNRLIPYKLPATMEAKLKILMEQTDLNCGSIDLLLSEANEYVFLEINPVGQYGWLEKNCNYPISRDIANELKKMSEEYE